MVKTLKELEIIRTSLYQERDLILMLDEETTFKKESLKKLDKQIEDTDFSIDDLESDLPF